jgi:hypothetical protein
MLFFFLHGCNGIQHLSKKYLLIILELVGYGVHVLHYLKGTSTEEKLSFYV